MTTLDLNSGALAPVTHETLEETLQCIGTIPEELNGTLIRNGPNPFTGQFSGNSVLDWWPEAAMLHGLTLQNGRAIAYNNRWIRTRGWAECSNATNPDQFTDTNPNVNIIHHGGRTLALAEGGPPLEIDRRLQTLGPPNSHPATASGMTAHPKIDPVSGDMISFRQAWAPPYLQYSVMDASGTQTIALDIEMSSPSMMHDMAVTESTSILLDLGVSFDLEMLNKGYRIPIRWFADRPSRLALLPRHGGHIRWVEIEPCFIQHVVNAYEDQDGAITLYVVRYPWYFKFDKSTDTFQTNPLGQLWRYEIKPKAAKATEAQVDDAFVELPRINDAHTGRPFRYCYTVEQPSNEEMRGIVKFDLQNNSSHRYAIPPGDQNSEPVFVARPGGTAEDDGWILVCVYRSETTQSEIQILDARDLGEPPLARILLASRIPAGFHGAWIPA